MSEAYPARAMESPFPSQVSSDGQGTFGSGYDFVGYAENKQTTMNKQELKDLKLRSKSHLVLKLYTL